MDVHVSALYVHVDRRITLKGFKTALEPHVGAAPNDFRVSGLECKFHRALALNPFFVNNIDNISFTASLPLRICKVEFHLSCLQFDHYVTKYQNNVAIFLFVHIDGITCLLLFEALSCLSVLSFHVLH